MQIYEEHAPIIHLYCCYALYIMVTEQKSFRTPQFLNCGEHSISVSMALFLESI